MRTIAAIVLAVALEADPASAQTPGSVARTMRAAGCTFRETKALPASHIRNARERVHRATYPLSSGKHHPAPIP
jgi:hypothetical protein